jgi:hypothetical protein
MRREMRSADAGLFMVIRTRLGSRRYAFFPLGFGDGGNGTHLRQVAEPSRLCFSGRFSGGTPLPLQKEP